jgi:ABC-type branched-subunit amino acid transport system substrate-binding protein
LDNTSIRKLLHILLENNQLINSWAICNNKEIDSQELSKVIEQICGSKNLRKLDFSYTKFDDKCASIISNYIEKHNTIVILKLEGCNLSNEAC